MFLVATCYTVDAQDVTLERVQRGDKVVVVAENMSSKPQLVTLDVTLDNVVPDKELPLELVIAPGAKKELLVLSPVPLKAWSYKTKFSFVEYKPEDDTVEQKSQLTSATQPVIPNNAPRATSTTSQPEIGTASSPTEESAEDKTSPPAATARNVKLSTNTPDVVDTYKSKGKINPRDYFLLPPENTDDAPMPALYARNMQRMPQEGQAAEGHLPESKLLVFAQAGCPRCTMTRSYLDELEIAYEEFSITGNDENSELMNKYLFDSGFEGGKFMMPVIVVDGETHYSIEDLSGFLEGLGDDE